MEKAIQQLFSKNETLISECEQLKETNERLQAENAELRNRLQVTKNLVLFAILQNIFIS